MGKRGKFISVPQHDGSRFVCAAWATHHRIEKEIADHVFLGTEGSDEKGDVVALSRYDWDADVLSEPKTDFPLEDGTPLRIAVHPGGDGAIISFAESCSLFEWEEWDDDDIRSSKGRFELELKLIPAIRQLGGLENVGPQNCLTFSCDGSFLATGGEDGHVRVFEWPTMDIVLDIPNAHKFVKDMDISLDSAFLSTTSDNSPCRIWDISAGSGLLMTLPYEEGENFGFCRFSRDGMKPFLFISVTTKEQDGLVSVWDLATWRRLGAKKFLDEPITSMAISHHGKRLAIGSQTGDISIIEVKKMEVHQRIRFAHLQSINYLEFSPNDKAILSLATDCSSRVSAVDLSHEWKEWQLYLVLALMVLVSMFLFYLLYEFGDSFWQFPMGKDQPHRPPREALGYDDLVDYKTDL
ncbi:prolactin regulatory element-binding protein [Marchantia polymorpha subsp. ruderalis]|uniref:Uncharacterized protein n=2 Tax=Marchantia polymorpha TaxID=3197 RepID=A0A176VN93_MARPO|nr:hypothetical protein AXG93_2550s1300 [Marchantia polymorpha subsp. ruderalis]PTQ46973.1 hypothetical protein MARPO_0009s0085 [Marchantia polymorpha]BBN17368.1 hypothetical protein Mp_7g14000 [Marchantia polymorpha subsp. ruderalis]|eukprot:PTQ46973.1 hypothetical protein MARPO_0009s0085 [Marchantia polymorpha]